MDLSALFGMAEASINVVDNICSTHLKIGHFRDLLNATPKNTNLGRISCSQQEIILSAFILKLSAIYPTLLWWYHFITRNSSTGRSAIAKRTSSRHQRTEGGGLGAQAHPMSGEKRLKSSETRQKIAKFFRLRRKSMLVLYSSPPLLKFFGTPLIIGSISITLWEQCRIALEHWIDSWRND